MTKKTERKASNRKPEAIKGIANKAIKELERIAFSEEEPIKIRMDILKWFTELEVGKPKALAENEEKGDNAFDIKVYIEE
ncbi:MAG: hypothetical protein Q4G23_06505 [Clostridia bacterium]|nr:hypothetical protein [Clostridia bacterium]